MSDGSNSEDLVKRIQALGKSEPVESTDDPKAEQEETEAAGTEEVEAEEVEAEEIQTGETSDGDENETDEGGELFVDIDGEEVNLEQIKEWKSNGLMLADYTRKTMSLAEQRKTLESDTESVKALSQSMTGKIASLESLITEDEKKVDWEELRDYDPSQYLKKKEEFKAKRDAVALAQTEQQAVMKLQIADESNKLIEKMPSWIDTKVRDQEIADAMQFATKLGFTDQDLSAVTDHRIYMALITAAKFDKVQSGKAKVKKKVATAPKVLKPSQRSKAKAPKTSVQEAKARLKKSGSEADAHAAMKALFG